MAELYVTKASHWWKPTRRDMVALKEAHREMDFCTKRLTKEAQVKERMKKENEDIRCEDDNDEHDSKNDNDDKDDDQEMSFGGT
ncbi:hypothetical protein Tco_1015530 [Tanacetum coccineum]|uniref:Uncharacterized protein n=1 Tax=Tanacetum coccineum TaxID=301880 RepID=A0ABQ5FM78_9ASTR